MNGIALPTLTEITKICNREKTLELWQTAHPEWHDLLATAFSKLDPAYLLAGYQPNWLPVKTACFNAFSLPLSQVQYVLLGESPYPRVQSANGYAFWDAAVGDLWCDTGMTKPVNRATSLRNWLKMLLVARGDLQSDCSQMAIAQLDKTPYWQTLSEFFQGFMAAGFILLNASLVYEPGRVAYHAKQWQPFMAHLLTALQDRGIKLVLLGGFAAKLPVLRTHVALQVEHPYNVSFVTNPLVLEFFKPFDLLRQK